MITRFNVMTCMFALALTSCLESNASQQVGNGPEALFSASVERLVIEVDYTGMRAAPNTDLTRRGVQPWSLTRDNMAALFGEEVTLDVPLEREQMQDIGAQPEGADEQYSSEELLAISARTRDTTPTTSVQSLHVIFVDGFYEDESGARKENTLGVSIGETGVIAMFKPVITGGLFENFVEQATLVHEIGHAAGLVNNGLEMVEDHHDEAHGAHCDRQDCVMYYQNEGLADVRDFIMRYTTQSSTVMFAEQCIADARAARPK